MSGIQPHSRAKNYPATVVCVGGFPRKDNDATAEVWYRGLKIKGFPDHKGAEFISRHIGWFERLHGVEDAKAWVKSFSKYNTLEGWTS